jgi:hypothetical protein
LVEIDGNILNGKVININAAGMISDSLRNANDGITYFGVENYKNVINIIKKKYTNDFILNISNIYNSASTIFKIFFDKKKVTYYLTAEQSNNDSVIFVKIENSLVFNS